MLALRFRTEIACPVDELADWHRRPGAFARLQAPWQPAEIREPLAVCAGEQGSFLVPIGPFRVRWQAEVALADERSFTDIQRQGPFRRWSHRHQFRPHPNDPESSILEDEIRCELPLNALSQFGDTLVRQRLEALFAWRHRLTALDLQRRQALAGPQPLNLLITGGSGLIGSALRDLATTQGHQVTVLSRRPCRADEQSWNPAEGELNLDDLPTFDAVIHLAGAGVAEQRWTSSRKQEILESRRRSTELLVKKILALPPERRPRAFVSASGISGLPANGRPYDESQPLDTSTFLGHVVQAWERAAEPLRQAGLRTVHARLPAVLDPRGGVLAKLLPIFRSGAGGPLGDPSANFAWIALDDVIDILLRACQDERYHGPIHLCTPQTPSRRQFAQALGHALRRPALLPTPALALRLALGKQMADETALADIHPLPRKLLALNYPFRFPALAHTLYAQLGQPRLESQI